MKDAHFICKDWFPLWNFKGMCISQKKILQCEHSITFVTRPTSNEAFWANGDHFSLLWQANWLDVLAKDDRFGQLHQCNVVVDGILVVARMRDYLLNLDILMYAFGWAWCIVLSNSKIAQEKTLVYGKVKLDILIFILIGKYAYYLRNVLVYVGPMNR